MSARDEWRAMIVAAYAQSRADGVPWFVYRRRPTPPPVVMTDDEELARENCDANGYTRVDASEGEDDGR